MSKPNVKSVAKDVAILAVGTFITGVILEFRNISTLDLGVYTVGCLVILASSWLIYPGSGEDHTLYDGQRLKSYILTVVGVFLLTLAIPKG
ncbi:hypothetical protein Hhis01_03764 [Haloarcula hispanica]